MIVVPLDAGASKAGLAAIRSTRETAGVRFACLRHAHLDLMLDGGEREEMAVSTLIALADWALSVRQGDEQIVFVVEGVEGHVYAGRSTTHLFDTADQAGGIRLCLRTWARLRGVRGIKVKKTTASAVRRFLFGRTRVGDNEVVIAVRACVGGMPSIPVPVPSTSSKDYAAMHSYDAGAIALVTAVEEMGMARLALPDAALVDIAKFRSLEGERKSEKKARAALKAAGVKLPQQDSRHTRRRRSEASRAAAAKRA